MNAYEWNRDHHIGTKVIYKQSNDVDVGIPTYTLGRAYYPDNGALRTACVLLHGLKGARPIEWLKVVAEAPAGSGVRR